MCLPNNITCREQISIIDPFILTSKEIRRHGHKPGGARKTKMTRARLNLRELLIKCQILTLASLNHFILSNDTLSMAIWGFFPFYRGPQRA